MTCAATFTLIVFSLAVAPPEITNAAELEKAVLAAREKIRNGSSDVAIVKWSGTTTQLPFNSRGKKIRQFRT